MPRTGLHDRRISQEFGCDQRPRQSKTNGQAQRPQLLGSVLSRDRIADRTKTDGNARAELDFPADTEDDQRKKQPKLRFGITVEDRPPPAANSQPPGAEDVTKPESPKEEAVVPTRDPIGLSLLEYKAIQTDANVPTLQRSRAMKRFYGKAFDWYGYYWDANLTSGERPISLLVRVNPREFGPWCSLTAKHEAMVDSLKRDAPIHISAAMALHNASLVIDNDAHRFGAGNGRRLMAVRDEFTSVFSLSY